MDQPDHKARAAGVDRLKGMIEMSDRSRSASPTAGTTPMEEQERESECVSRSTLYSPTARGERGDTGVDCAVWRAMVGTGCGG